MTGKSGSIFSCVGTPKANCSFFRRNSLGEIECFDHVLEWPRPVGVFGELGLGTNDVPLRLTVLRMRALIEDGGCSGVIGGPGNSSTFFTGFLSENGNESFRLGFRGSPLSIDIDGMGMPLCAISYLR